MARRNRYWPASSPATWLMVLHWEWAEVRLGWTPWWRALLGLPRSLWVRVRELDALGREWTERDDVEEWVSWQTT